MHRSTEIECSWSPLDAVHYQRSDRAQCEQGQRWPWRRRLLRAAWPRRQVFAGLLVGAMLPYWFSAMTMKSVGKAALAMVEEVRRQFNTISGLMEGTARPDYVRCVEISTQARPPRRCRWCPDWQHIPCDSSAVRAAWLTCPAMVSTLMLLSVIPPFPWVLSCAHTCCLTGPYGL